MSVLFKLLNVVVIIQKVMITTSVQQYTTPGTYTVMIPANSAGVTMSMWGAGGAGTGLQNIPSSNAIMYPGGSGAFVSCSINAPPGSTIYLLVGGGGGVGSFGQNSNSAIGGGGQGTVPNGADSWSPAGGGGRSAIQFSSGVDAIVAGGGGGGGACNTQYGGSSGGGGGGGGLTGLDGGSGSTSGGGGTTSSGGKGGISTEHFVIDGTAGTLGIGGNGGRYGSGGGGGYYGGGGSGVDFGKLGAGGGGSSYIGGCNQAYPITYLSGVTGTTKTQTMPGGWNRSDYISGVGVGNVGIYAAGGNGAIVLTFTSPSAAPTSSTSASPSTSTSNIINIIIIIAIVIGSILFSGTIIFYGIYFFSVLRSNDATMDFDDTIHNDTRSNQEYNNISPTFPDEEVYPTSVVELPIAKAVPTDDESENLPVAYIF